MISRATIYVRTSFAVAKNIRLLTKVLSLLHSSSCAYSFSNIRARPCLQTPKFATMSGGVPSQMMPPLRRPRPVPLLPLRAGQPVWALTVLRLQLDRNQPPHCWSPDPTWFTDHRPLPTSSSWRKSSKIPLKRTARLRQNETFHFEAWTSTRTVIRCPSSRNTTRMRMTWRSQKPICSGRFSSTSRSTPSADTSGSRRSQVPQQSRI